MKPTEELARFIKGWEACRLRRYLDSNQRPTIGWGHLILFEDNDPTEWTQKQADAAFSKDLRISAEGVDSITKGIDLTQYQFDALVDFSYQKGFEALRRSTLIACLVRRETNRAAAEFTRWAGLPPELGELRRSCAQQAIFLCGDYSRRP